MWEQKLGFYCFPSLEKKDIESDGWRFRWRSAEKRSSPRVSRLVSLPHSQRRALESWLRAKMIFGDDFPSEDIGGNRRDFLKCSKEAGLC
jgi:hypothetical protein